jgi:hypothetical protein
MLIDGSKISNWDEVDFNKIQIFDPPIICNCNERSILVFGIEPRKDYSVSHSHGTTSAEYVIESFKIL